MFRTWNLEMTKNNEITIASIEERKLAKHKEIDKEDRLEPQPGCCIYRVPKILRSINEEAYTPQVISIGPLHHGKEELVDMEKQKIRYKREFGKRISVKKWQELVTFIEEHEQLIRNCYEDMPKFEKLDFITMIFYDAIFIIEHFLRRYEEFLYRYRHSSCLSNGYRSDFLINKIIIATNICLDLQLLENQLPYFILEGLYMLAFPKPNPDHSTQSYPSFFTLSCMIISDSMLNEIPEETKVKHFVDLRRYAITKTRPERQSKGSINDSPCALKLKGSGLKLKGTAGKELLDIKFEKKKSSIIIPWLKAKVPDELQIPRIQVYDGTEKLIRNVMALEQCHYPNETHVCNYIDLMDNLINTEEDVNLLTEAGIISNNVGYTARIANMFNKLGQHISLSPSCYHDIVGDLKAHYENPWNHAKATLKSVYFSNYWRGTATIAAIALLLLTLMQTVCSILQVVDQKM